MSNDSSLLWFKNDLRIHDNEALFRAYESGDEILPVFVIDDRLFSKEVLHFKKASTIRKTFLLQTLCDLRASLKERGGDLLILEGIPEVIIAQLVKKHKISNIFAEEEYADEELKMMSALKENLPSTCNLKTYWGKTLYHKDDIPYTIDKIPLTSKAYRINTTKNTDVRPLIPIPKSWHHYRLENYGLEINIEELDRRSLQPFVPGGELHALKRLDYYTTQTELLTSYKWTRNRSLGLDYSSKLSPYLALGAISPRRIYFQVQEYEKSVKKNISTWWLVFEVVWRDYFTFKGMRMGNAMFKTEGYSKKEREFTNDYQLFEAWCEGNTGIPFIDAHMRQLNQTGYMSNRGRVNCASFLVHDLQIDWTWGAAYFESLLIDYDVSANWMNWHMQAYEIWYTNPVNQSLKYKAADYIAKWIPQLREVADEMIYIPWKIPQPPANYPAPVVMFTKWNRAINKIMDQAAQQELF